MPKDTYVETAVGFRIEHLVEPLRLYLRSETFEAGPVDREVAGGFRDWITRLLRSLGSASRREQPETESHAETTTGRASEIANGPRPDVARTLELIALLLRPAPLARSPQARRCLELILQSVSARRPVPSRFILERLFRGLLGVALETTDTPFDCFFPGLREESGRQWVDLSLCGVKVPAANGVERREDPETPDVTADTNTVRLIPLSIFTRRFFHDVLPDLVAGTETQSTPRVDPFHYHPENNKAIELLEDHPVLGELPFSFQYFVDDCGLSEVIIDTESLDHRDAVLATRLFCLLHRIRSGRLDGEEIGLLDPC